MRRWPSISKLVKDLSEDDKRVRIFGTIVSIEHATGTIAVDDGTGAIKVFFNSLDIIEKLENYKVGDQVMVIGWVTSSGIDGEIIRRIEGFDPKLYVDVLSIWHSFLEKISKEEKS